MDDILNEIYDKIKWQRRWAIIVFIGLVLFLITVTYFGKNHNDICGMTLTFIELIYVIICGRLQHLMKFINHKLVHPGLLGIILFFSFCLGFYGGSVFLKFCGGFGILLITINLLDKSWHIIQQQKEPSPIIDKEDNLI